MAGHVEELVAKELLVRTNQTLARISPAMAVQAKGLAFAFQRSM